MPDERPLKSLFEGLVPKAPDLGSVSVPDGTEYREPTDVGQGVSRKIEFWYELPRAIYAATSSPGHEIKGQNIVFEPTNQMIFLDVGRWLKDSRKQARDFGVIWGWHVYLCEFAPFGPSQLDPPKSPLQYSRYSGLDYEFFDGMKQTAVPVAWASATWANPYDFDWGQVYVIAGDMHLLAGKQASIWYAADNPYDNPKYMRPERDFFHFARRLCAKPDYPHGDARLKGKVKFIQIGDSFDLWVGCGESSALNPLFTADPQGRKVKLRDDIPNVIPTIKSWVQRIQGFGPDDVELDPKSVPPENQVEGPNWVYRQLNETRSQNEINQMPDRLKTWFSNRVNEWSVDYWKEYVGGPKTNVWRNPADAAFKLLEKELPTDDVIYVYGNHDDYLSIDAVCAQPPAALRPRVPVREYRGVVIEHAHRMEIPEIITRFTSSDKPEDSGLGGLNADGLCIKAQRSTNDLYLYKAHRKFDASMWVESKVEMPQHFLPRLWPFWVKAIADAIPWAFLDLLPTLLTGGLITIPLIPTKHLPIDIAYADWFDQPYYILEYAKIWAGRRASSRQAKNRPWIFVIGHTHLPLLGTVTVTH